MSAIPTNRWSLFELCGTYYQDSDCNDIADPGQEMKISAESNGSGAFLVLSTRRWAVSGPSELQALLADFIGRGAGLPLEQATPAPAVVAPLADLVEPVATDRDYNMGLPEACGRTYLCDACGHDGGNAFDDCNMPGCKGSYLASRPPMGPHLKHEYGFGKPAGPYPVEAVTSEQVPVTTTEPHKAAVTMGECPYCKASGPFFENCATCVDSPRAWYGATLPVVVAAPEPVALTCEADTTNETPVAATTATSSLINEWTPADIAELTRLYPTTTAREIALKMGRTQAAVKAKIYSLALEKEEKPLKTKLKAMPVKAAKKASMLPRESEDINPGLETKLLKLVDKLGGMKLFKMDEHEARQALQLLTNHVDKLAWVPGAERLRERLAGCYSLPTSGLNMEGSAARA